MKVSKKDFQTLTVDHNDGSIMLWGRFATKQMSQKYPAGHFHVHIMTKIDRDIMSRSILEGEVFILCLLSSIVMAASRCGAVLIPHG